MEKHKICKMIFSEFESLRAVSLRREIFDIGIEFFLYFSFFYFLKFSDTFLDFSRLCICRTKLLHLGFCKALLSMVSSGWHEVSVSHGQKKRFSPSYEIEKKINPENE